MVHDRSDFGSKTHYRTIFISDVHLGTKGCQADQLIEFLKSHTCDQLYLVGDIFDGWRMKQAGIYWPQTHNNVVRNILTKMKRGTEVILVTGNHDEFLRRHSPLEIGNLRIVDQAVHRSADGLEFLVVHGDEFDVITRYHRWIAWLGDIGYTLLLEINRHFNKLRSKFGYGYWSLSAWLKYRVKKAVSFIGEYEAAVAQHCRKQEYDGIVCGHIHHAEISDYDGVRYINCGDWVESCTAITENHLGEFKIVDWLAESEYASNIVSLENERLSA